MTISMECPGCGKRYKVKDQLAGRRVRCKCGEAVTVPTPDAGQDNWLDDVFEEPSGENSAPEPTPANKTKPVVPSPPDAQAPDDAFYEPRRDTSKHESDLEFATLYTPPKPEETPPAAQVPAEATTSTGEYDASFAAPVVADASAGADDTKEPLPDIPARQRRIAHLSIGYGVFTILTWPLSIMVVCLVGPRLLIFSGVLSPIMAGIACLELAKGIMGGTLIVGGLKILKDKEDGASWAGLSCLAMCFVPAAIGLITTLLYLFFAVLKGDIATMFGSLGVIVLLIAVYFVPAIIVRWCWEQEAVRREREAEEDEYRRLGLDPAGATQRKETQES